MTSPGPQCYVYRTALFLSLTFYYGKFQTFSKLETVAQRTPYFHHLVFTIPV